MHGPGGHLLGRAARGARSWDAELHRSPLLTRDPVILEHFGQAVW